MKIAMTTKRLPGFCNDFEQFVEARGHQVQFVKMDSLCLGDNNKNKNNKILSTDLFVLKSKHLFFIYAGLQAKAQGIPVIPDPHTSFLIRNRLEFPLLARRANIETSRCFFGHYDEVKKRLTPEHFPLLLKTMVGSGSDGIRIINSVEELPETTFLYLEHLYRGEHMLVYFIENEIRVFRKKPFVGEQSPVEALPLSDDVASLVKGWQKSTGLAFGDLDLIRTEEDNRLVLVDPGTFPQFSHWEGAVELVSESILKFYYDAR